MFTTISILAWARSRTRSVLVASVSGRTVLTTAALAMAIAGCSKISGNSQTAAFQDGRKFLQGVRLNDNPEKVSIYRAFNKAGVPLPAALTAALSGQPVVDDGIREARVAAAKQISGDNQSFRAAGVPSNIPMVDKATVSERIGINTGKLALNDQASNQSAVVPVDAGSGPGNAQCTQVNASCYAFAVASASAFACAYASAWACVFAEVPPFRQLCTWAYSEACATAMSVAFAATYSNVSVNVCNSCPGGGGGGGDTSGTTSGPGVSPLPPVPQSTQPTSVE